MNNPCDIWFRIFVIVFILISSGTFLVLILRIVLYYMEEREIDFLRKELKKCKDDDKN
jgi:hypothetical protein